MWKNGLTEANICGILYLFKLKYVPVIQFLKYFECIHLSTRTWISIITFGGHHASKFIIIYSYGGHIGLNYTNTSLKYDINYPVFRD